MENSKGLAEAGKVNREREEALADNDSDYATSLYFLGIQLTASQRCYTFNYTLLFIGELQNTVHRYYRLQQRTFYCTTTDESASVCANVL